MRYLFVALPLLTLTSMAYGAEDCSRISNTNDRLVCFDRQFPAMESKAVPRQDVEAPAKSSQTDTPIVDDVAHPAEEAIQEEKPKRRGMFDKRDEVIITSIIKEVMKRDRKKMVFQLDNGQVWIQSSPRDLHIRAGDQVTIKSGLIGGYILRNSAGTSTRVKLIDK